MQYKQKYKQIRGFSKFDFRINQLEDDSWEIGFSCSEGFGYYDCTEESTNLAELLMMLHNNLIEEYSQFYDNATNVDFGIDFNPQKGIGFNFYLEEGLWYVEIGEGENLKIYTGKDLFEILIRIDDEPIPRTRKRRKL